MIDVEQRALGAFEEDRLAVAHRLAEQQRHVADPGTHALAVLQQLLEHRPPVHRGVLDETVAGRDVVADVLLEPLRVGQVADADAPAGDLVLVGRPDAARRGPDLALAAPGFRQKVEIAVIRQDQVRLVADDQASGDVDAGLHQLVHLGEQRLRIDDEAVADDARDARVQNAGRDQPQHEFRAVDVHGVAGVVSALIARDDRKLWREEIDDLPFAFVAPLRSEDG